MRTKELGTLTDKLLIFGGTYGNIHALSEMQSIAKKNGYRPNQVIFTGDAAAYCAYPERCVQLLDHWDIHAIAGNVEIQLREDRDDCGCNFEDGTVCNRLSQQWYPFVKKNISDSSLGWMHNLPDIIKFTLQDRKFIVVHGSYSNVSSYIFKSTEWEVKKRELNLAESDVIIAGHSGIPFYDINQNNAWINAGVIGMPANDGTPRCWYLTIEPADNDSIRFELKNMEYDYEKAKQAMEEHNLPKEYSKTLRTGIWDNCEILPPAEAKEQGEQLEFTSRIL